MSRSVHERNETLTTAHTTIRRAPAALAAVLACALLAACGSSSSSSTSSTTSSTSAGGTSTTASGAGSSASRTALRACLKAHGVTLPTRRPGSGTPPAGGAPGLFGAGGGGGTGTGRARGGFAARNPKLAAAIQACGGSQAFRGGGRRFRLNRTAVTKYVACVRTHGYNLPSPNFSGKGPIFPANIRTNAKFISASKACASLLVPARGASSGSSGGAPPSTS